MTNHGTLSYDTPNLPNFDDKQIKQDLWIFMGYPIFLDRPICIINLFHHATMQPGELGCCQVIKEVPKIQMEYRERTRHVVDDFGSPWLRFVELFPFHPC
jgi:hypothetical protein